MTLQALLAAIAEAHTNELPAVAMALAGRMAALTPTMAVPAAMIEPSAPEPAGGWIRPERAAEIAGEAVDTSEAKRRAVRRIYAWAHGQRWASRPSRRCLRINEPAFRRWLETRK